MIKFIFICLIFMPDVAFAYVDPGIVSLAIQGLFAFIFSILAAWIIRPWDFFKNLLNKSRFKKRT